MLIYARIAALCTIVVFVLVIYFLTRGKYSWTLLVLNFIGAGLVSFYIFYYIGSYKSSVDDITLMTNLAKVSEGSYSLLVNVKWNKEPDIFGFNGTKDALVVRYNPAKIKIVSADKSYDSGIIGKGLLMLPADFEYSIIDKRESEIRFYVKDGEDYTVNLKLLNNMLGSKIKVFFIHDFKLPIETSTYWEKGDTIIIDK